MNFSPILTIPYYPLFFKGACALKRDHKTCALNPLKSLGIQSEDKSQKPGKIYFVRSKYSLNNTLNFRCDMLWSPNTMFVWYFLSILILFFLFQINMQFLFILKYISFVSKNKG